MAIRKLDGIIEAVRYTADGNIALVRVYERRGAVWSDQVLLERNELTDRLKQGKRFAIGERKIHLGGVFETGRLVYQAEGNIITEGKTGARDILIGVPVF